MERNSLVKKRIVSSSNINRKKAFRPCDGIEIEDTIEFCHILLFLLGYLGHIFSKGSSRAVGAVRDGTMQPCVYSYCEMQAGGEDCASAKTRLSGSGDTVLTHTRTHALGAYP